LKREHGFTEKTGFTDNKIPKEIENLLLINNVNVQIVCMEVK